MAQCGITTSRRDITQSDDDAKACLRPEHHLGPHLIFTREGYVAWKYDPCRLGTCPDCDSEDSTDQCCICWEVSDEEAGRLMYSTDRGEEENP